MGVASSLTGAHVLRDPIRILHLIDTLRPGGAEQLVLTTVKHLDPRRFVSMVVALAPPLDLKKDLESLGISVHHFEVSSQTDVLSGVMPLVRLLRDHHIDILHTHLRLSNVCGRVAALLAGTPAIVTTLHHLDYTHWAARRWRSRLWKWVDRTTARLNKGFVAVSYAVGDDYARHFDLAGAKVIHNYIDPAEFPVSTRGSMLCKRQEFNWTEKEFVLLNVARLAREKGQRYLLQAMAEIVRVIPEARLAVIGEGPEEEALKALCRTLGLEDVVVFAGNRRDVASLLGMGDLFVFPSIGEGLGIAPMEAMATGLPVVACRADGISEVVEDGVTGLLVAPQDPGAISEAIFQFYRDVTLRRRVGEAGRRRIQERFSISAGIPRLEALYREVAPVHACP